MIADHRKEIEILRSKIRSCLAEKPPRRKQANLYCIRLNLLIKWQLKREAVLARKEKAA